MSQVNRWRFRVLALLGFALATWATWSSQGGPRGPHLGIAFAFAGAWVASLFLTSNPFWRRVAMLLGLLAGAAATLFDPGLNTLLAVSVGWAGAMIPWRRMAYLGVAVVLFACAVSVLASGQVTGWQPLLAIVQSAQFFNVLFLYGVVLLLGRFATDNTDARRAQQRALEELQAAHAELQERAATVEELATLRERARLSRELHDTLGHALSAVTVQLEAARRLMPQQPGRADDLVRETQEVARSAMRDLRVHLSELREPSGPQDIGEAVRRLADLAASQNGWRVAVQVVSVELPERGRKAMFQVAKEALENCERHARATRVLLTLEPKGANAVLTVEDDGCGFAPERIAPGHFGIAGMRERLRELGGDVIVESSPGHGTCVTGTLPTTATGGG